MNNIEILEEFIEKNIKSRLRTELNANELQAIENLIQENKELRIQISARETVVDELEKENKELKEENNRIKSLDYTTLAEEMEMGLWMPRADVEEYYIPIENLNDYIPKSKVKEKIEVLKMKADYDWVYKYDYKDVIKILQELLEEGE